MSNQRTRRDLLKTSDSSVSGDSRGALPRLRGRGGRHRGALPRFRLRQAYCATGSAAVVSKAQDGADRAFRRAEARVAT
jgi:hypothetical protein